MALIIALTQTSPYH